MRNIPLAGLVLGASSAMALDVPGAGEDPGFSRSSWWLTWGNDYLGNAPALHADDYRTNRFDGGVDVGAWRVAVDWSNLTLRRPHDGDPAWGSAAPLAALERDAARRDELSATVQRQWHDTEHRWWLAVGPGVRLAGDLGGAGLQGAVHAETASHRVDMPYEHAALTGAPYAAGRGGVQVPVVGPWTMQARQAVVATTMGEVASETGLRLAVVHAGSAVWCGPLWAGRWGSSGSTVADAVADHERGPWLAAGVEVPGMALSVGNQWGGPAVEGRMTVRRTLDASPMPTLPVEAEAGVIPWGRQPSANEWTLRMLLGWPTADACGERLRGTVEVLRGELDLPNTYDMAGSTRRLLVGLQMVAWSVPAQGPWVQPYVGLAGGLLRTEVHPESSWHVMQERRVTCPVASGEAGLRLGWSTPGWRTGTVLGWAWVHVPQTVAVPWQNGPEQGTATLATSGPEGRVGWWVALGW